MKNSYVPGLTTYVLLRTRYVCTSTGTAAGLLEVQDDLHPNNRSALKHADSSSSWYLVPGIYILKRIGSLVYRQQYIN